MFEGNSLRSLVDRLKAEFITRSERMYVGSYWGTRTITASTTATLLDVVILANTGSGAITVTLPIASSATGKVYTLKKISSDSNIVAFTRSGSDTIDGAISLTIPGYMHAVTVASDGTSWYVVNVTRRGAIALNSYVTGAVNGSAFAHAVTSYTSGVLVVVASEWIGSDLITGATVNGVAGTQLFIQGSTAPSFMRAWYWKQSQLPAPGSWSVLVSGVTNDTAAISMLFDNVSQSTPFASSGAAYKGSLSPSISVTTPSDVVLAACGAFGTNSITSAGTLGAAMTRASGNAKLGCAWGPPASSAAFTVTGDTRTSIGYAALCAA